MRSEGAGTDSEKEQTYENRDVMLMEPEIKDS